MMNFQNFLEMNLNFDFKPGKQNKIILLGIQGSGKTTVASKLAKFLTNKAIKLELLVLILIDLVH